LVSKLEDGRVLEGILDLAFVENDQWVIVDFKTDADTLERRAQYERQLQWYGFALRQLTNMPARAWLLEL
jgi:ATP-dependent helicase/nuclease subunit A